MLAIAPLVLKITKKRFHRSGQLFPSLVNLEIAVKKFGVSRLLQEVYYLLSEIRKNNMSQKEGFTGGFIVGSLVGGVIGGLIGTIVASRTNARSEQEDKSTLRATTETKLNSQENIEFARRSLESKIAQLNLAIDDVREQLSNAERNSLEKEEDLAH
jgi:hypothetical protein